MGLKPKIYLCACVVSAVGWLVIASAAFFAIVSRPAVPNADHLVQQARVVLHRPQAVPIHQHPWVTSPRLGAQCPLALSANQPLIPLHPVRLGVHAMPSIFLIKSRTSQNHSQYGFAFACGRQTIVDEPPIVRFVVVHIHHHRPLLAVIARLMSGVRQRIQAEQQSIPLIRRHPPHRANANLNLENFF